MSNQVYIVAEAGVNHNGDLKMALDLVEAAKKAGADAVKFQTFFPGECTGKFAVKVNYLEDAMEKDQTRYDLTSTYTLPIEDFKKIKAHCDKLGIEFITTPDGEESLKFIVEELGVKKIKTSSTDVTNLPFLKKIASYNIPIIFSTGLSTLGEIEQALHVMQQYHSNISILHCISEYPAPPEEVNLRAIKTIREAFKLNVGFSDHTLGNDAAVGAVCFDAHIIEKHFTLDRNLNGPDHKASLDPTELTAFVKAIRNAEKMLGNGIKEPSISEKENITGIRRSIVAKQDLKTGTVLTEELLACKRPGYGIQPLDLEKVIGFKINTDLKEDQPLLWEHLR